MDSLLQFLFTMISGILALLIFIYVRLSKKATTSCSVPEVGGAWPIIGHLHLLSGHQLIHKTLSDLAEKYGPVYTMRLGSHRALVVSNCEMARECFTIHDKAFSTRPALADGCFNNGISDGLMCQKRKKKNMTDLNEDHVTQKATTSCSVPEVGGAWPIIGHLHLLSGHQLIHKTLSYLADKYGPVYTLRLGSHRALVVSNCEMTRECFTIHDKAFSTRPAFVATKLIGYDAMFGFAPYGSYWREMRKITTIELLSNHRLYILKHIRASEVETAIKELYKTWMGKSSTEGGVLVDMKHWFGYLTYNIAFRLVGGKRIYGGNSDCQEGEARRCQELMKDLFYYLGVFVLSDVIPYLGWLDFGGHLKAMKRIGKELDTLMEGWLEEHKQKRLLGGDGKNEQDFMDVMLTMLKDAKISGFDADTINKATCLNVIVGSDTNMVPLTWALSLLLNNQDVLKKAQEELDIHVGKDRMVEESDIKNLVYLQAILKETFRLYPPGPVLGLRSAMEDCTLSNGYRVRAGTRLLVNTWKIQHDERLWSNPDEFQPERFLTSHKDTDVSGQNHELIPFGSGRRACPGISLALQVVHLTLASLLHSFDVAKSSNEPVDMTESPGLSNMKATPLEVLLTPRLNPKLYGQQIGVV